LEKVHVNGTKLECLHKSIDNLNGLEMYSFRLEEIDLNHNMLTDIKILEKFTKLKKLDIGDNSIDNIEPISKLIQLESLIISSNKIKSNQST
jgi:Leucine-rich repeat (LRR) protein